MCPFFDLLFVYSLIANIYLRKKLFTITPLIHPEVSHPDLRAHFLIKPADLLGLVPGGYLIFARVHVRVYAIHVRVFYDTWWLTTKKIFTSNNIRLQSEW